MGSTSKVTEVIETGCSPVEFGEIARKGAECHDWVVGYFEISGLLGGL
jgi:hypothetical protein